ncbi:MAG: PIN domain-containing protein [Candidatus Methanoperedens sp.]|nr:PIN domain-containing protein [Candidatus Methanoperedens sp.]
MNTILIDTMHLVEMLKLKNEFLIELAKAINKKKLVGVVSVVSLTELIKILAKREKEGQASRTIHQLTSSNLTFVDVNHSIAIRAGELRVKYDLPTVDALIAATGVAGNVKHFLTDDDHFDSVKNLIKPIDLKAALKLAK